MAICAATTALSAIWMNAGKAIPIRSTIEKDGKLRLAANLVYPRSRQPDNAAQRAAGWEEEPLFYTLGHGEDAHGPRFPSGWQKPSG